MFKYFLEPFPLATLIIRMSRADTLFSTEKMETGLYFFTVLYLK